MKIVSVNRASVTTIAFNGEEVPTGIFKRPVDGPVGVQSLGLEGDAIVDQKVHGGLDQAVYFYHKEDYDWWSEMLGKPIAFGTFGENLTLSGAEGVPWVIGDRVMINDVELEITAPRAPCFKLGVRMGDSKFVKQFVKACRPGAYARVITPGTLAVGDELTVLKATEDYPTVNEVFTEWHRKDKSVEVLKKALSSPIASVHKAAIKKWYAELT